jgi:plastocyanin
MRDRFRSTSALLALALVGAAPAASCSRDREAPARPPAPAPTTEPAPAPEAAAGSEEPPGEEPGAAGEAGAPGTIRGSVRFEGQPPPRKPLAIGSATGCQEHGGEALTEDVIVAGGKLANVVVYVDKGPRTLPKGAPGAAHVLDQLGCVYRPHVSAMQVGQALRVKNSDPATHNVHSHSKRNDAFNRSQPPGAPDIEHVFDKTETIQFVCDIHPWMKAWIVVRPDAHYAVTSSDGSFELRGLPPGAYEIEAWHEKLGTKTQKVTLAPGGSAEITFTYAAK